MKKIIFYIAFALFFATHVSAQTTYSFSGLTWGDPIQVVDNKLKAAGFSGCAMHEKLFCKAATTCRCQIQGPAVEDGWAELTNGKLEQVFVVVHDWSESADVLANKYGPPSSPSPMTKYSSLGKPPIIWMWTAKTGESLELLSSHRWLTYTSGNMNHAAGSRDRANKSVF